MGSVARLGPGFAQSVVIAQQRRVLDAIGERLGTPVLYVKAAWADPVLYEGRGLRTGCDIDVLVRPAAFVAFATELAREGYQRRMHPRHLATNDAFREWCMEAPVGLMPIDLHRGLANEPWFALDADALLDRGERYPSPDGPILSLSPEDQVVYAAAHYANSLYRNDERHLRDIERLLALRSVDWDVVLGRAREAYLDVALLLLLEALGARGAAVPRPTLSRVQAARVRWLRRFLDAPRGLERAPLTSRLRRTAERLELVTIMAAVSTRSSALPWFLGRYAWLRLADARRRLSAG